MRCNDARDSSNMRRAKEQLHGFSKELGYQISSFLRGFVRGIKNSSLWVETIRLFLKSMAIISLLILAAIASFCFLAWSPFAVCPIFSVLVGYLIGWKLSEKRKVKAKFRAAPLIGRL